MLKVATTDSAPASKTATTGVDRREAFKSIAALAAATVTPPLVTAVAAQAPPRRRIVFSDDNAVVEIAAGRIRGYTEDGIHTFKGIPYASAPTGDLRFMPPEKPKPWPGVQDTLAYGPACPQPTGRYVDLSQFFFEYTERA